MAAIDRQRQSTLKAKMFLVACTVVAAALIKVGAPLVAVGAGLALAAFLTWQGGRKARSKNAGTV